MRIGGYDYATRHDTIESKSGRAISSANQGTLEEHQQAMQEHLTEMTKRCTQMQESVKGLSALWQNKEPDDGKSITRREPSEQKALTREQPPPLQGEGTEKDLTVDDLEALLV
jgi:hypothetical protein